MTLLTLPQQHSADHGRRRSPDPAPPALPAPAARRLLREEWGLTRRQVAAAFGVTVATVRFWETGRTSPVGRRRVAYARFLTGLAEAGAVRGTGRREAAESFRPVRLPVRPAPAPEPLARPVPGPHRLVTGRPRTGPARRTAAARPVPGRLPTAAVRPLPVGPGPDPVSPPRRRRMRHALVAAGVWCTLLHHLLATGVPLD
ncbi:helix-turn-helix domain-containing protein [Streptomyces cremeus]|uniref:Helix-turn-helix domain-containing protein n=1 Tax=Streptomyces cremeus TaxID=66881 RepID=A0ABV5PE18_STRCM